MMKKKYFICFHCVVLILFLILVGSACSPKNNGNSSQNCLKIGTIHRVKSENILFDHALDVFTTVSHPPLLTLNDRGEVEGFLADHFDVSTDFTSWTFYIKENFFWSDGEAVKPKDVQFSLEYIGRHVPSRRWIEKTLSHSEITPGNGVKLTFIKPYTRLDIELTSLPIIPSHIWEKVQRPRFFSGPGKFIGYGPFIIDYIDLNAGIISFKKNKFWRGKQPVIRGIEVHMFQNPDVLSLALEKGKIDTYYKYADTYPYANIAGLKATGKFNFLQFKTNGLVFLGFNLVKGPASHLNLRQAITLAIDYEEIRKLITDGYGQVPTRGFIPPGMLEGDDTPVLKQDLTTANSLLKNAGFRDSDNDGILENSSGKKLRLLLLSTPADSRLCQLLTDYLNRIGIKVENRVVDSATWISMKEQYEYDITVTRSTPWGMLMHAGWGTGYFDSRRTGEGVLHTISDPLFLKLCDTVLATRDPEQLKIYANTLRQYFADQLPAVALVRRVEVIPFNKFYSGWFREPLFGIFNATNFLNLQYTDESK